MKGLTISRFARECGVGIETVRYYQRRGLLDQPPQSATGGFRRYGGDDVRRLRFIRSAQAAGFTLDQIAELLALDAAEDRARAREIAVVQLSELDARIAELEAARNALRHLAGECMSGVEGPCPIIMAFERSGAGGADASHAARPWLLPPEPQPISRKVSG